MKPQSQIEIDAALHTLGGVQPPPGLEGRVKTRLDSPRRKLRTIHFVSAASLAASIAISTFALGPALRESVLHAGPNAAPSLVRQPAAGLTARPAGDFGPASAVHVPTMPIPVAPLSAGPGRGHTRSTRAVYSAASRTSLPRRVAVSAAGRPAVAASGPLAGTPIHSAPGHP